MNNRQKRIKATVQVLRDEYYKQDEDSMDFGIKKMKIYMMSKRRGLITATEYNLYRDAIEKFIGVK